MFPIGGSCWGETWGVWGESLQPDHKSTASKVPVDIPPLHTQEATIHNLSAQPGFLTTQQNSDDGIKTITCMLFLFAFSDCQTRWLRTCRYLWHLLLYFILPMKRRVYFFYSHLPGLFNWELCGHKLHIPPHCVAITSVCSDFNMSVQ